MKRDSVQRQRQLVKKNHELACVKHIALNHRSIWYALKAFTIHMREGKIKQIEQSPETKQSTRLMTQKSPKHTLFNYTVVLKLTLSQITKAMSTYSNHLCLTGYTVLPQSCHGLGRLERAGWEWTPSGCGNGHPVVERLEQGVSGRRKSPGPTVSHSVKTWK